MTFGEKIKQARKAKNLTQKELAALIHAKHNSISNWENDQNKPDPDTIELLCGVLGLTPNDLLRPSEDGKGIVKFEEYNPTHKIPILGRISAGLPLYAEENIEGYTYTELNGGAEYFALRVKGDSMNAARIFDGDIIIVRRQDIVENGSIAVVLVDDEDATVKIFSRHDNLVTLMPQSHNPIHQPQIYDLRETKIDVLGLVVKCEFSLI